ncbi:MAG: hypothetical protein RL748_2600 [Pseudomonadota bacterium]|jgi:hypothetical protein
MKTWVCLVCFSVLLGLSGCASVPRPNLATTDTVSVAAPSYAAWNRVLQKFVDDQGRVNFAALAQDRTDLDQFVSYIYDVGPNNQPQLFPARADVLAYHINAYNALAMYKVLATGIPDTLAGAKKISFFAFGKVQVGGQPISLYDYENKVIRPLGDARVHMALNCMSVSCPRLPKTAFVGALLAQQLQQETESFLSEARNLSVDGQRLLLSEIFKLYLDDFLREAPSLPAWINRYRKAPLPDHLAIEFTPYNWAINRQP